MDKGLPLKKGEFNQILELLVYIDRDVVYHTTPRIINVLKIGLNHQPGKRPVLWQLMVRSEPDGFIKKPIQPVESNWLTRKTYGYVCVVDDETHMMMVLHM